ncbi:hypothetical protein [Endozoicomonas sp. SCSIO W0465]|uniref:hypothetical protein n=1 Tax=Endozoicomonas sp. SCSIO W0465 TaxID=2918516 RepID=UPI00207627A5|nr:hypothetical protein [Endozoicomonas sp. SCSIO W0465]USE38220.1 hypothetical protein MJO57_08670 [Endozoicomonas sp. SCSIO W0465]
MLPNTAINQTSILPRVQPQSVESLPSQQLEPGYFNYLPVVVIEEIAKRRNFSKSAGSRIISVSRLSSHHGFSRTPAVTT